MTRVKAVFYCRVTSPCTLSPVLFVSRVAGIEGLPRGRETDLRRYRNQIPLPPGRCPLPTVHCPASVTVPFLDCSIFEASITDTLTCRVGAIDRTDLRTAEERRGDAHKRVTPHYREQISLFKALYSNRHSRSAEPPCSGYIVHNDVGRSFSVFLLPYAEKALLQL
ncbi:hypothetical protein RRG08_028221 [Elysia crispata]|uniref:Uncharacterized protein n=1 Tax=Elysia crispata TaxID=231223 RepID=A0AAE1AT35_9GAST|nr:hypothetical protein RRG08_028221 [Elysia crispata]